jgi:hypothetical protein
MYSTMAGMRLIVTGRSESPPSPKVRGACAYDVSAFPDAEGADVDRAQHRLGDAAADASREEFRHDRRRVGREDSASAVSALSLRRVADGLDVVAIRIAHERSVVVLVVMRSDSRRAIVFASSTHGRCVEAVDSSTVGPQRDMS